ncbi:MAG: hypothetical protein CMF12_06775 [Idiomarina sp.]|uniref:capsule biosynthesis GfcC family protein n=1 Tax=Idiomarina sp. TaxID=1874361 RepID=UPI000C646002|nr:capsule biosynthesis GfcC family protein [Idiomarina sp.]MBT42213.1 hypothetical protein [Idiomarina sp.]
MNRFITLVLLALVASLVTLSVCAKQPQQQATETRQLNVQFANGNSQQYSIPQGTRLATIFSSLQPLATQAGDFDWAATRLGSTQLQYQLQGLLEQTQQQLNRIQHYARGNDNRELANAAQQLQQQLNHSQFFASYYLGIPWHSMRLQQQNNPQLNDTHSSNTFTLMFAQRSNAIEVFGLTQNPHRRSLQSAAQDNSVQALLKQHPRQPQAETSYVWQINLNGAVAHRPVANYNQHQLAQCYEHDRRQPLALTAAKDCRVPQQLSGGSLLYIGLDESELPDHLRGINTLMVRLLKHYHPAGPTQ